MEVGAGAPCGLGGENQWGGTWRVVFGSLNLSALGVGVDDAVAVVAGGVWVGDEGEAAAEAQGGEGGEEVVGVVVGVGPAVVDFDVEGLGGFAGGGKELAGLAGGEGMGGPGGV